MKFVDSNLKKEKRKTFIVYYSQTVEMRNINICKLSRRHFLSCKGLSWNEQKNPKLLLFIAVDHQFYRKDQEEKQCTIQKKITDIQVHFLSSEISSTVSFLLRIPIRVAQSWFVRDLFTCYQEPSIVVVVMLVTVPVGSSAHR